MSRKFFSLIIELKFNRVIKRFEIELRKSAAQEVKRVLEGRRKLLNYDIKKSLLL